MFTEKITGTNSTALINKLSFRFVSKGVDQKVKCWSIESNQKEILILELSRVAPVPAQNVLMWYFKFQSKITAEVISVCDAIDLFHLSTQSR